METKIGLFQSTIKQIKPIDLVNFHAMFTSKGKKREMFWGELGGKKGSLVFTLAATYCRMSGCPLSQFYSYRRAVTGWILSK